MESTHNNIRGASSEGDPARNESEIGAFPSVEILDVRIHNVSLGEAFDAIDDRVARRDPGFIVTPNVDHICRLHREEDFRRVYAESFLSLADGTWVMWAAKLLRKPIREKISGSDLVFSLTEHAARKGHSIFLFGAADGVAEEAAVRLQELYPGLKVAGTHCPPMGFDKDDKLTQAAIDAVIEAQPDICYVALGAPKQEYWMRNFAVPAGVPVSMGIGAGLDFVIGREKRAPVVVQKMGLEWAWRMKQDPKRLIKRYLWDDRLFWLLLVRAFWRTIIRGQSKGKTTPST